MLTLLLCTDEFSLKCSWLFRGDNSFCSQFYYVQLRYSEKGFSYSDDTIHTLNTNFMYRCVFLNVFLVVPRRP